MDDIDHKILELLVENGRRTLGDIGQHVGLSTAAVKRRVDRLEQRGVIRGYTALVDPDAIGPGIDAFIELYCADKTAPTDVASTVKGNPDIVDAYTVAGDPDALVRIRVNGIKGLKHAVQRLRRDRNVVRTKTLIVLSRLTQP